MKLNKRNIFRIIWFSVVLIFFIWQSSTYQARNVPESTFSKSDKVSVTEDGDKITFLSNDSGNKNEIIFFQGGFADPEAYAPLCRRMAESGFTCHLIKMDWRMPQWDYKKIKDLFKLRQNRYIIGGHSQGAKMAAQFVYENAGLMKGLFLLGTSHPRDVDLSERTIPTLKLFAEFDGLASVSEVMENKEKLPKNAAMIMIKGGNHSQFGYLGTLLTDENATIDLEKQQDLTLEHLAAFFKQIEN